MISYFFRLLSATRNLEITKACIAFAFLLFSLGILLTEAFSASTLLPTFHLDGAFQTASSLLRLSVDEAPGRDFLPYLGVGLVSYLNIFFRFTDGSLAGSVFASYFATSSSYFFTVAMIAFLLSKERKIITSLFFASVFLIAAFHSEINIERIIPGNSLRPLRAFIPYIVFAVVSFLSEISQAKKHIIYYCAVLAGFSISWSNDYGIPTASVLIIFGIFVSARDKIFKWKSLPISFAITIVSTLLLLYVITKGHPFSVLEYNFRDVRQDQYWYFAPWTENSRIFSLAEGITKIVQDAGIKSILFLLTWTLYTYARPSNQNLCLLMIGYALLGGGILATIGGHRNAGYFGSFRTWTYVMMVIVSALLFLSLFKTITPRKIKYLRLLSVTIVIVCLAELFINKVINYVEYKRAVKNDANLFYSQKLGGYLPLAWKEHLELAPQKGNLNFIEEYWGLWSAYSSKRVKTKVDAAIHALGKERSNFASALNQLPSFVVTSSLEAGAHWQAWSLSANYWFYEILFRHYTARKTSPTTILWTKRMQPSPEWPNVNCTVRNDDREPTFELFNSKPGFYQVTIALDTVSLMDRSLLMLENNINYASSARGFLSIDSSKRTVTLPVLAKQPKQRYATKIVNPKNSQDHVTFLSCTANEIIFDGKDLLGITQ